MPKPLKLAFLTTDFPPDVGGLQEYSFRIARDPSLPLRAVDAAVTAEHSAPRPRSPEVEYRFHRGRSRWKALPWSIAAVWRKALTGRANAFLHMQWSTAVGSWMLGPFGFGGCYFVLAHGAELLDSNRALNWVKRRVLRGAEAVITGSQATAGLVRNLGVPESKIRVVPYGCDPEVGPVRETRREPGNPLRFACMHRLVPRKGTALFIEALAGLKDRHWTLDIVGEGEERAQLLRQVMEVGLFDRVRFLSPIPPSEKSAFLRDHDLLILPSLPPAPGNNFVEGLGLGLLEAQAAGVAVLAARTGGIPEAIDEGKTGILFQAGDMEDLRSTLGGICAQPETLRTLGAAGPAWIAKNFSWQKTLRDLARILVETEEA